MDCNTHLSNSKWKLRKKFYTFSRYILKIESHPESDFRRSFTHKQLREEKKISGWPLSTRVERVGAKPGQDVRKTNIFLLLQN
jgi:hypothetical protein